MRLPKSVLFCVLFFVAAHLGWSQEAVAAMHATTEQETHEHHGLPQAAVEVHHIGSFPITNSMIVSWIVALGLIICARVAMRNAKEIPSGAQNFWEWMIESLYLFLEGILGRDLVKKSFWFFATIFIFILFTNWFGLIPGVGTIGYGHQSAHGFVVERPIFRGGNADLNMTMAMSIAFFGCWIVWALQANGPGGFLMHIFGPKGDTKGGMKVLMIVVFLAVGLLEVVSIMFRPVSLSFRLYGNIFAGENLLEAMSSISAWWGWAIALPFYLMELMVGIVQALVFMLLTSVFTMLICEHEEGHAHGEVEHHH